MPTHSTRSTHVIEQYTVTANTIECVCGWKGNADLDWVEHKRWGRDNPIEREPVSSLFKKYHSKKFRKEAEPL